MMNKQIAIEQVKLEEAELLLEFAKDTFEAAFAPDNSESDMEIYLAENFTLEKIQYELSTEGSAFYFARIEARIVGYLKVNTGEAQTESVQGSALEIERIYVHANFYGTGVAQRLYDKAIDLAKILKVDYVWLGVWEENARAIKFYEKCGFVTFDKHAFKLGESIQTDLMMRLDLNLPDKD